MVLTFCDRGRQGSNSDSCQHFWLPQNVRQSWGLLHEETSILPDQGLATIETLINCGIRIPRYSACRGSKELSMCTRIIVRIWKTLTCPVPLENATPKIAAIAARILPLMAEEATAYVAVAYRRGLFANLAKLAHDAAVDLIGPLHLLRRDACSLATPFVVCLSSTLARGTWAWMTSASARKVSFRLVALEESGRMVSR